MAFLRKLLSNGPRREINQLGLFHYPDWSIQTPPPPIDSRGTLRFSAGQEGPTQEQIETYFNFVAVYNEIWQEIAEALFEEYSEADEEWGWLTAETVDAMPSTTRLFSIIVHKDCSLELQYALYSYHTASNLCVRDDHDFNVTVRDHEIVSVAFEG